MIKKTILLLLYIGCITITLGNSRKEGQGMSIDSNKTIFLIDGSGFLYRAYFGLKPLHTIHGVPVQAVYSFCRMIKKLLDQFNPKHIALVWDSKGKTTRHELYPEYKATRSAPPSDLFDQKVYIQQFADLIGLKQIEKPGIEADDLMYSLAQDYIQEGFDVVLITSDKDMEQLLSDKIIMFDALKDLFINPETAALKRGFIVQKLPFYFSLVGDASDNIPGVKGIGIKTATTLVQNYDSLKHLYDNIETVSKESTKRYLLENKDNAFLSEELFLLRYVPLHISHEKLHFDILNWSKAEPLFKELNFKSLLATVQQQPTIEEKKLLSELKGYTFSAVTTLEALDELIAQAYKEKIIGFDTELDGLNPLENNLIGLSLAVKKGEAFYIPFGHVNQLDQLPRDNVLKKLEPLFLDTSIKKVMHHANFDERVLRHYGLKSAHLDFDTLLAAHLVTADWQKISLKALSEFYLHEKMQTFSEVVMQKGYKNFSQVPLAQAIEYAACDAHQTLQLMPIMQELLKEQNMQELYYSIELPLVLILCCMEQEGIYLDKEVLDELNLFVTKDLHTIKEEIIALTGCSPEINLNSPKQIEQLLFTDLKLETSKKSAKKTGYSTDVEVLQALSSVHPVPALLLKYRELAKLKNTYIDALPTYINKQTGKIHTTFSQTAVTTGRLASSEPNLQNIPTDTRYHVHIRSAFKPKEGHVFLSADYSQIELRVLAYFSQDAALIDAFIHNQDIHAQTAAKLFDVSVEHVTPQQRQIGKRINFSILYGLTPFGLSKDLGIPFKQAQLYIQKYFEQYPGISTWMDLIIEGAYEHGYVTTHWGRKRYVPGIYEKNKMLHDVARRIAINTPVQGTAAEIMKIGMINLDKAFKERNLKAHMVLQIHDELLLEVPIDEQEETEKLVHEVLEHVVSWNIPLLVTTRFGKDWQEVTK